MKVRCALLLLCVPLLLTACKEIPPEQTPSVIITEPPQQETPAPSPVYETARAAADGVRLTIGYDGEGNPIYGETLKAGQKLTVLTLGSKLCLVETKSSTGTVPRWEVLLRGESTYETWKGSIARGTGLFSEAQLINKSRTLNSNSTVTVLFASEDWLYVELDGEYFFVEKAAVTKDTGSADETDVPDDWTPAVF